LPTLELLKRLHAEDVNAVRATAAVLPKVSRLAERVARCLAAGGRLVYVGAGTSGRLGALDAAECPPTFGTEPRQVQAVLAGGRRALWRAVEGAEDDEAGGRTAMVKLRAGPGDVILGLSASGQAAFVWGALKEARRRGAYTALLTSNPRLQGLGKRVDVPLVVRTGPELVAGSTRLKAGTAQKLVLNALSTAAMVRLGRVYAGRMVHLKPTNRKLRARATRIRAELGANIT
jgi:N-acetylmuramic acid 6-phosphate etherase